MFRRAFRTPPSNDRRWLKRLGPLSLVLALVGVLAPSTLIPAGAADATESLSIQGCRNNGSISLPNADGDFICADSAYTPGNLGKGWNELDLVPFRVTATGGTSTPGTFSIVLDNRDGGNPGYDVISVPVLNDRLSDASCTAPTVGAQTNLSPGLGGADISIYREVTITQAPGSTCVYDYYGRLALGSHLYPGSSLHANLANENQSTAGIGSKEVSIPVREILPQELRKDMTATQGSDHVWNVTKAASRANLSFDDTCTTITAGLQQPVSITVAWTKLPASPTGEITIVTHVYAKNPAARTITVNVTDQIYSGTTAIGSATDPVSVAVPANTELLVLTHSTTVPAGTTNLNDIATATYTDLVTGIPVPGTTTARASATVQTSSAEANATATIADVESITGNGFSFSVDSVTGSSGTFGGGYTLRTHTTDPVSWTSGSQSGSGSVTFVKTVYATAGVAGSGSLSDTATLTGSDGFTTAASASVGLSARAMVTLNINKTIPNVLTGDETVSFDFQVFNADDVLVGTRAIAFSAGDTSGSASVPGLAPGTYTVHEVPNPSGEWGIQEDRSVTIALPSCSGSVSFANTRNTGDLLVEKVTTGGTGTFRFDVDCDRDAYDRLGDDALTIVGSGTAGVTGILTGTVCTVTERDNPLFSSVVTPDDGEVTIVTGINTVSFENTRRVGRLTISKTADAPGTFTFDVDCSVDSFDRLGLNPVVIVNGGTHVISDIPTGTTCEVTERDNPLFSSVVIPDDGSVEITTEGETVTFTNTRLTGPLTISKSAIGGIGTFTFDVDCSDNAFDQVVSMEDGESRTITGIPTTTTCTVTERSDPLFTSSVLPVNGAVTIDVDGEDIAFVNTAKTNGIILDKKVNGGDHATTGDALPVHAGDSLTYTVVITNNGLVPLTITALSDSLYAGLITACPQGIGSVLAVGASFTCTYTVGAVGDANNVASVTVVDGLGRTLTDRDGTYVDVLNPGITIVKTANPVSVSVSGPVTYTYVVTNTGDTTLRDVLVTDDILGVIGRISELAPGESVTLAKTVDVDATTPPTNIGTVVGTDVLGQTVTANDDATITVVLGLVLPAELPRTGSPLGAQTRAALALIQVGLVLTLAGRRRRMVRRAD
jgi:uncharacterized repeat protein (TIGR01451 family)